MESTNSLYVIDKEPVNYTGEVNSHDCLTILNNSSLQISI